jgi:hypothetical protein
MVIDILIYFLKEVPKMTIDEITVGDRQIHIVRIYSPEAESEIRFLFHDEKVYSEFIAQLKSETWFR